MKTDIYLSGSKCQEHEFGGDETSLEQLMIDNYKALFGNKTIFLSKKKIETKALGDAVPDGFLFGLEDKDNPVFYLVEVELDSHSFETHIFPQITKFIAFMADHQNRKKLIEKLYDSITSNRDTKEEFARIISGRDIHKIITDAIENSQDILLVLDKLDRNKAKIEECKEAYAEWDKHVKVEILKLYEKDEDNIITLTPPFEEVEISEVSAGEVEERYDENYHLSSANDVIKGSYAIIKEKMLEDENLQYNPQKYYISILRNKNFAYIKIRRTKMHIVVMLPYEEGGKLMQYHKISELSQGVQDWYGAPCFRLTIEDKQNLDEVIDILRRTAEISG
jgi:predicted transport protein